MRRVLLATVLLVPMAAWAQTPQPPNVQALQQTIIELTGDKLDWRTQAIALQAQLVDAKAAAEAAAKAAKAQVADLQKQLAAAQAKPQEPRP